MYTEKRDIDGAIIGYSGVSNGGVPFTVFEPIPDSHPIKEWLAAGNTPNPDPEWTLANVQARKLAEIRAEAASILYAKWPQWLRDNFNIGMDAELKPLYAADVALIRSESGCATPGQESGFEGDVALLTTIDEVLAYTYTFTAI